MKLGDELREIVEKAKKDEEEKTREGFLEGLAEMLEKIKSLCREKVLDEEIVIPVHSAPESFAILFQKTGPYTPFSPLGYRVKIELVKEGLKVICCTGSTKLVVSWK